MTWLRVEDTSLTHPKVMHLRSLGDPVATAEAVVGFVMLAASWSGQHDTDCFITEGAGLLASPEHWQHLAVFALKVGILTRAPAAVRRQHGGQQGWLVKIGKGEIFHLLSKEEVERNKARRSFGRKVETRVAVLLRDGDQCRYCGQTVDEDDRKGGRGRTWDHPDPAISDDVVVACRSCNSTKRKRTVDQWVADGGLPLLPEPVKRGETVHLNEKTRAWLRQHDALLDGARDGTQSPAAAPRPAADQARARSAGTTPAAAATDDPTRSRSDPDPIPPTPPGHAPPGRDGTGRVGSGPPGRSTPSRDGPRTRRGSRGRGRSRTQQDGGTR